MHVVSDLDGTWLPAAGDEAALRALEAFVAGNPGTVLTFATGRRLESTLRALDDVVERYPDHLITDVGTVIHHRTADSHWEQDLDYDRWVASRWNAEQMEASLLTALPPEVCRQTHFARPRRLALQAAADTTVAAAERAVRDALSQMQLPADVLASSDGCIDVLPREVNKGSAVEHLARRHGMPRPLVVCGDAENDVAMLRVADVAVVVAGGRLSADAPGLSRGRVIQTRLPGPAGILEVLRQVHTTGVRSA